MTREKEMSLANTQALLTARTEQLRTALLRIEELEKQLKEKHRE